MADDRVRLSRLIDTDGRALKLGAHPPRPQRVEVTGCEACPFVDDERGYCTRDSAERFVDFTGPMPPDWCPLRARPVLVALREG